MQYNKKILNISLVNVIINIYTVKISSESVEIRSSNVSDRLENHE